MVRNSVLAPPSCRAARAVRKISVSAAVSDASSLPASSSRRASASRAKARSAGSCSRARCVPALRGSAPVISAGQGRKRSGATRGWPRICASMSSSFAGSGQSMASACLPPVRRFSSRLRPEMSSSRLRHPARRSAGVTGAASGSGGKKSSRSGGGASGGGALASAPAGDTATASASASGRMRRWRARLMSISASQLPSFSAATLSLPAWQAAVNPVRPLPQTSVVSNSSRSCNASLVRRPGASSATEVPKSCRASHSPAKACSRITTITGCNPVASMQGANSTEGSRQVANRSCSTCRGGRMRWPVCSNEGGGAT